MTPYQFQYDSVTISMTPYQFQVGTECKNSNQCSRRGDVHGANIYDRAQVHC